MDKFALHHLKLMAEAVFSFERGIKLLKDNMLVLFGYFDEGFSRLNEPTTPMVCQDLIPVKTQDNKVQSSVSYTCLLLKEIKEMIIELKIRGSVRERANGLIELRTPALGSIYGRTREEIELKLTKRLKEVKNKKPTKERTKAPLLSEFFISEYIPYKKKQNRAPRTIACIVNLFKHVTERHFNKSIDTYKPQEIEDFLYKIPHSRTRQILQGTLNNIFNRALTVGVIKANPCSSIEKMQHTQNKGRAFSFDEQVNFFDRLISSTEISYKSKCYLIFVYLTGTRKKEAIDVEAKDIDLANKTLAIRGTKTASSDREIPLTPLVEKLLRNMDTKNGKIFDITEKTANRDFRTVWKKSEGHKLHDLRHTFGTIQVCVEKIDIKTVSLWLGHSTIDTTLRIYTHPEQLDNGTFLRGDLSEIEKIDIYKRKYGKIIDKIDSFLRLHTH